jgi:hypothetical protein
MLVPNVKATNKVFGLLLNSAIKIQSLIFSTDRILMAALGDTRMPAPPTFDHH